MFLGNLSITEVVDAAYDDIFHTFGIIIIINDQRLLNVVVKQEEEPLVDLDIKLNLYTDVFNNGKCCFLCSKAKGPLLLLIDEYAVLCIFSKCIQIACKGPWSLEENYI